LFRRSDRIRHGEFRLTEAVRPAVHVTVPLREGFRRGRFRVPESREVLRTLCVAVSAERLFDVFLALLEPFGEAVEVVLESSHDGSRDDRGHELRRDQVETPILASYCCEFEDLLLNDGCTGIAVLSEDGSSELQFDEHKHLTVYSHDTKPFRRILRRLGLTEDPGLNLVFEADHWHSTTPAFAAEFEQFCGQLGVGESGGVTTEGWDEGA